MVKYIASGILALSVAAHASASPVVQGAAAVRQLVQNFLKAEQEYDAASLSRLIDSSYVEVSPLGEVDEHDRFLGFYAADKKAPWPPTNTGEEQVRIFGNTAIDVLKITYTIAGPDGVAHTRELRGSFIAQKQNGVWKLLGAQYTGIRPSQPKP